MSLNKNNIKRSVLLQNKWVRILISFLGGAMLTEYFFIITGDPNRPRSEGSNVLPIFVVILFYFVFTFILKKTGKIE